MHVIVWTNCAVVLTRVNFVSEKTAHSVFPVLFSLYFLTVYRNEAYNIPLESYLLGATSPCWTLFEIPLGLRAVSKILNRGITFFQIFCNFRYYFRSSFWTVCRNEACNMPLESYRQGATFICRNGFEIPYSFKLILKIVWRTTSGSGRFSRNFYKPVVEMIQYTVGKISTRLNFFI